MKIMKGEKILTRKKAAELLAEKVVIPEGYTRIGKSLENLVIPASVSEIGAYAFAGCKKLTLHAPRGSYAIEYAKENGIAYREA